MSKCLLGAVAASCALAVCGCGSSSGPHDSSATGGPLLALARCMRAHGVSGFPDPKASGGLVIPSNINPQAPVFVAAQRACASLAGPGGGGSGGTGAASRKLKMLALARCIRKHGVPDFPDPSSTPPPPGNGNALGGPGAFLQIPNPVTPAFRRAAAACHFSLP